MLSLIPVYTTRTLFEIIVAQLSHPQMAVDLKSWFSYDHLINKCQSISNTQTTQITPLRAPGAIGDRQYYIMRIDLGVFV